MDEKKCFLIVWRIKGTGRDLMKDGELIISAVHGISGGEYKLAFRSSAWDFVGYYALSNLVAGQIRAAMAKNFGTRDADDLLVLEIGPDWAAHGNSEAWRWLQHHSAPS